MVEKMIDRIKKWIIQFWRERNMSLIIKKILCSIWIILKVIISMVEGIFCSIAANRLYNVEKHQWNFISNLDLIIPCCIIAIFLILISAHDVKKVNLSLEERKENKLFDAKVKLGVFDTYANELNEAIKNGDKTKFKTLKEMEEEL